MSNKTEILSFDEWINGNGFNFRPEQYDLYKFLYEAGQQSKQGEVYQLQAEIDELQKNFNNALKTIDIQQQFLDDTDGTIKIITSQVDELQNRIDELKMTNHNLSVMTAEAESYSDYWKYELDKLQKRIEDALKELEYIHFYKTQNSNNAIKILKGDSHES